LLQSAYQLVEDALIVLSTSLKVFFQCELRFANRMKSQLLIRHRFSLIKQICFSQKRR